MAAGISKGLNRLTITRTRSAVASCFLLSYCTLLEACSGWRCLTPKATRAQRFVDLGAIYSGLGEQQYRLKSMVSFYGAHYQAFVWSANSWFTFDDSAVSKVGNWRNVVSKCRLGHIQPAVLLFERVAPKKAAGGRAGGRS